MTIEPQKIAEQGIQAFSAKKFDQAASAFAEAASAYEALNDPLNVAEMKKNQSVALLQAWQAQAAYDAAAGTDEIFAQTGDVNRQAMALGNQAAALDALKKLDQALEAYERSAALFAEALVGVVRVEVHMVVDVVEVLARSTGTPGVVQADFAQDFPIFGS